MREYEETGKTVLGQDWPLEERTVAKDDFVKSYIDTGKMTGEQVGFLLGRDSHYYYIAWYRLGEEKVILLKCPAAEFVSSFPAEQDKIEMEKGLPEFPVQPIGLENANLKHIVDSRHIVYIES